MRTLVRDTFAPLRSWKLILLHLIGNIVLPVAAALWLLIPEAKSWQLIATVLALFLWFFLFTWLESSTFLFASDPEPANFRPAFRAQPLPMLWVFLGFLLMFWLSMILTRWSEPQSNLQFTGYLYSKAPAWLRPSAGSLAFSEWFGHALEIIAFFFLPGILLPATAGKVLGSPWKRALRTLINWRYWLGFLVIAHLGLKLPSVILDWRPGETTRAQEISLVIRFALVLICVTVAWIMTTGLLGHFLRPRDEVAVADIRR
jgi:hypothetical protein